MNILFSNNTRKNSLRLSGIVVLCCVILAFFSANARNVPTNPITSTTAALKAAGAGASLSFSHAPVAHLSHLVSKTRAHLSIRSKHQGKPLFKNGPGILAHLFQLHLTAVAAAGISCSTSTLTRPGYYLFLFRYALF